MAAKAPTAAALHSAHLVVSGKVQGVFYRKYTRNTALELGLTGWVRNLPDGRVEIVAEGTAEQLAQLQTWCHKGSPHAKVTDVTLLPSADSTAKTTEGDDAKAASLTPVIKKRQFTSFNIVK